VIALPAGATLFDFNQPSRKVFLLRSGWIQLWSARDAVTEHLVPGDFFGQQCFLQPRPTGQVAKSLSPVKISVISKAELLRRLQGDHHFGMRFLRNLAVRIDRLEQTIRDFVTAPAEYRLARLLLRFVPGSQASGWVRLMFSPSNSALAKAIGTTRSRVAHFMSRFQQLGWLRRRPDLWVHYESLREFVEFGERAKHAPRPQPPAST
jgi:CRP-like cAMP-binding protein